MIGFFQNKYRYRQKWYKILYFKILNDFRIEQKQAVYKIHHGESRTSHQVAF